MSRRWVADMTDTSNATDATAAPAAQSRMALHKPARSCVPRGGPRARPARPSTGGGRAQARVDRAGGAARGRAARADRARRALAARSDRAPRARAERPARPARSSAPRAIPVGARRRRPGDDLTGLTPPTPRFAGQAAFRAPTRDTGCGRGHSGVPPVVRVATPLTVAGPPRRVAAAPTSVPRASPPQSSRPPTTLGVGRRCPTTASSRPGRPAWRGSTPSGPGGSTATSGGSEWNASPSSWTRAGPASTAC
jgi:hypothetical protein